MKENISQKKTKKTCTNWVFLRRKRLLALLLCMAVLSTILPDTFTAYAAESVSSFIRTEPNLTISWKENAAWGGSISAEILLKNNGSQSIENWQLSFDWTPNISSLWCATYEAEASQDGKSNHYTIAPYDYNGTIAPEGEIAIGFIASGEENTLTEPEFYSLAIGEKTYTYNTKDDSIIETTKEPVSTEAPTEEPAPTTEPIITEAPTEEPTEEPVPTSEPLITLKPTEEPTLVPTEEPTLAPTEEPTLVPTEEPLPNLENWEFTDDLIITRDTTLNKNTSCHNLIIKSGTLNTAGYDLKVRGEAWQDGGGLQIQRESLVSIEGDYCLTGDGILILEDTASHVLVKGNFHNDTIRQNELVYGTMEIKGDVSIESGKWIGVAIAPTIKLSGDRTQTVEAKNAYFYNLDISESAGVDFVTDIYSYSIKGTENIVSDEVCFRVEKFTLEEDTVIPCDVIYAWGYWDTKGYNLRIQGDLTQTGMELNVNGGSAQGLSESKVSIEGDYYLTGDGILILADAASHVLVEGDFHNDTIRQNEIVYGSMEIKGDVCIESGKWVGVAIAPTIKLSGDRTQIVEAKDAYLYNLDISESAGVDFVTDIYSYSIKGTENIVSDEVCFRVEKFTLEEDTVIPCDVIYAWGRWDTKGHNLRIQGDLTQTGMELNVNGGSAQALSKSQVSIEGDYCLTGDGILILEDTASHVLVEGDFYNDTIRQNELVYGTMEIKGDVCIESGKWVGVAIAPTIKLSGDRTQTVEAKDAYFYNLDITESKGIKSSYTINADTLYGAEKLDDTFNGLRVNRAEISEDGIIRGNLHLYSGMLDINGHDCTVRGSLRMDSGSISMIKDGSCLTVRDEVKLEGGCLDIGEGTVHIKDDLNVRGTATIAMKEVSGILDIDGDFTNSSTYASQMETGVIYLGGSLIQKKDSHPGSMRMHCLNMNGHGEQRIKIRCAAQSNIHILNMTLANQVDIQGTVCIAHIYGWDKIISEYLSLGGWTPSLAATVPIEYKGTLHLMSSIVDLDGATLTLGGLDVYESLITVGTGHLVVNGDFTMQGNTVLDMTDSSGTTTVRGDFTTLSCMSHVNHLTDGVFHLYGNLKQGGYPFSFAPSGNFKLHFVYRPGVVQEVFLTNPAESCIPEENRSISHKESVIFNVDEGLHVTAETLYDHFYAGAIEEITKARTDTLRYITTETFYNLLGELGGYIGLKISHVDGKVICQKLIANYGMAAITGVSVTVMVSALLCTGMWSNIGNPHQAAKDIGSSFVNIILSIAINNIEDAVLSVAKDLGTYVGGKILNADEIGEMLIKQINFEKLLDDVLESICKNFQKFRDGVIDMGSYIRHDLLPGILPNGRSAVEKLQKYLTESASRYLEKEVAAGNLTEEMLEKVSSFLSRHTAITELSEVQLRLCTLYDGSESFFKKVLWAGENEELLAKVSGEGIERLYHRFVKEAGEDEIKALERLIRREMEKAPNDLIGMERLRILEKNAGIIEKRGKDVWWNTTKIEPSLPEGSKPSGNINPGKKLADQRENESAALFASKGYKVEQLEICNGGNGYGLKENTNPDYLIEGKVFDCYAPRDGSGFNTIVTKIRDKILNQTPNIVLNLEDYKDIEKLLELIKIKATPTGDLKRLEELWIIKNGKLQKLF